MQPKPGKTNKNNASPPRAGMHTDRARGGLEMPTIKQATTEFLAGKRVAVTGVSRTPQGHGRYASKPAASAVAGEVRA